MPGQTRSQNAWAVAIDKEGCHRAARVLRPACSKADFRLEWNDPARFPTTENWGFMTLPTEAILDAGEIVVVKQVQALLQQFVGHR